MLLGDSMTRVEFPPSMEQLRFLALPSDIVLTVFSFMDQQDCLTCMAVCYDWYTVIPQYAQNAWKSLRLGENDIGKKDQCVIRCLGDHVKSVIFNNLENDKDLYDLMHQLLEWGCSAIESLEMYECNSDNQGEFLDILIKLAPHLRHLKMMHHHSNIAFLQVFSACPELTHFTYQETTAAHPKGDRGVYDKEPVVPNAGPTIKLFPNITHLCIDAVMDRQLRLDPILKRCPNLLVFVGPAFGHDLKDISYSNISIDFDLLFDWCPKIVWVEDMLSHRTLPNLKDDPEISAIDNSVTGLRHFSICELHQSDAVQQRLTESQHILEFFAINPLAISSNGSALPIMLSTLQLPQLHTLDIHDVEFDGASIVSLLNHCPSLRTLNLEYEGLEFDSSNFHRLNPMISLHNFSVTWMELVGELSLLTFLERFPSIETLSLYRLTAPAIFPDGCEGPRQLKKLDLFDLEWRHGDNQPDPKEAPAHLFRWFAMYSKLEAVSVLAVSNFGTSSLAALGTITTLQSLEIGFLGHSQCGEAEKADLHRFALSLVRTKIANISIIDAQFHFPEEVVRKLNELPQLRAMYVFHPWDFSYCNTCTIPWKY
ncbi:hypothetical protein BJV82DRAFT_636981 [Fennellomyces sp. T-0311]|nr:hypothetical protein BJV82DRAFT_636981 [Fennellomyces sp. T-0311]